MADIDGGLQLGVSAGYGPSGEGGLVAAFDGYPVIYFPPPPTPTSNPVEVLAAVPASGTPITGLEYVQFDVRSLTAFRRVVLAFRFSGLEFTELAYAQDPAGVEPFETQYSGSTVTPIVDGVYFRYRFQLLRNKGWPASPELEVIAFNEDGEES